MALGAVALGYGHPAVNAAVIDAVNRGTVGPLSPEDESQFAAELGAVIPWLEKVRFLKTGAEAVAAAVRIARTATGRDATLGCGYHGWLDWSSSAEGVPAATRDLFDEIAFNDVDQGRDADSAPRRPPRLRVVEPAIESPPATEWLAMLREETERIGAVLIFDEIKTGFRIALGGAAEKWDAGPTSWSWARPSPTAIRSRWSGEVEPSWPMPTKPGFRRPWPRNSCHWPRHARPSAS